MIDIKKNLDEAKVYNVDLFFDNEFLRLNSNENLLGTSPKVLSAIKKTKAEKINFYPCYGEFLNELSKIHHLKSENFLPTNGCDEAISVVFNTYLECGDNVVSYAPTFAMPKIYAEINGANFNEIDYEKKWEFEVQRLIDKAIETNAKIIHLTSPNSPTGELIKIKDIEKILETFPNKAVLLDNTYVNFSEKNQDYIKLINKFDNLFIAKSFSKDYALAGLRLGYVISSPLNIQNLKKVISPYSVNNMALLAGTQALCDKNHIKKVKSEILKNKEFLTNALENLGFRPFKSEGNFILCDFGEKSNFIYEKLLKNKILVKKFNDERLKNCFRITICDFKNTKKLVGALKPRTMLVFDLDGVVFDVRNSYRKAIEKTFKHLSGKALGQNEIQIAKNSGGLNCDWDLTKYLLEKNGTNVEYTRVVEVFQEYFFSKKNNSMGLIDEEKLILDKKLLQKLSKKYDLCVFTGRPKEETLYSLKKYDILKYFNIIITKNDLPNDRQKPCPDGLYSIKVRSLYSEMYYFGDTTDDIKCAVDADVVAIGVLPPQDKSNELEKAMVENGAQQVIKNINKIKDIL